MIKRKAFTLLEVLISIALLSLVLLALYKSVSMLSASNLQLFEHLEEANQEKKAVETLFLDIASSDGNISIENNEFSRLCIESTRNSLYALSLAKVCWLVSKKDKSLMRSEGNYYELPLESEERVAVDSVMVGMEVFDVYRKGGEVLVLLQQKGQKSMSFMVHGVPEISTKKKVKQLPKKAPIKIKSSPSAPQIPKV